MSDFVLSRTDGHVGLVTLNRPEVLNALSVELMEQLIAAVDTMCEKLINKLPECTRYTKQQLNFWRDFSWSLTVGHARDWLAIHNLSPETREGITAFMEKRPVHYSSQRQRESDPGPHSS